MSLLMGSALSKAFPEKEEVSETCSTSLHFRSRQVYGFVSISINHLSQGHHPIVVGAEIHLCSVGVQLIRKTRSMRIRVDPPPRTKHNTLLSVDSKVEAETLEHLAPIALNAIAYCAGLPVIFTHQGSISEHPEEQLTGKLIYEDVI